MLSVENNPRHKKFIEANLSEYGEQSQTFNWVTLERALTAGVERKRNLAAMGSAIELSCRQTKPHLGSLSPGCRICSQGSWSCLFINGKCNCHCFYCPTSQDDVGVPTTNRIPFAKAGDYAAYIDRLGFQGVSISGGEPLVTFERAVRYIEAVRSRMGDDLHIWLYTNGTLLTAEYVTTLKDAGLNEIRFDLSAVNYDLKKVALAAGRIPCVTVEIPAIPEDRQKLAALLPDMLAAGVNHLNLHQLRMTPHNSAQLQTRKYTYLHGEKVTVLESELTALALMQEAQAKGIGLPVNYCSFVYKHRYQRIAVRRRNAPYILKDYEGVTQSGFIRTLVLSGSADSLARQVERFSGAGEDSRKWLLTGKKDRLFFHQSLWPLIDFAGIELRVSYAEALLCAHTSYRHTFKEIRLTPKTKLYVEKQPYLTDCVVPDGQRPAFEQCLTGQEPDGSESCQGLPDDIRDYEFIRPGLQDYF